MSKRNPNAASVPQGGITVRYGGGIAPKADVVVTVPQGDDMGVAEENFEGAFGLGRDLSTLGQLYDHVGVGAGLVGQQVVHACGGNVRRNCPPLRVGFHWIFVIFIPTQWIGFDVFGDIVHFAFVADDVFVIIPLPNGNSIRVA